MEPLRFDIDSDIARARTMPGRFYTDPRAFERVREQVFAPSWQLIGDARSVREPGAVQPSTLLEGLLDVPVLLTRTQAGTLHCLSNVCTHRGNLIALEACRRTSLVCGYHGRRFELDGTFRSMPEFEKTADFPRASDDLARLECRTLGPLVFASMKPSQGFDELTGDLRARLAWFPFDELALDPSRSKDYVVGAHWALYCDNYLEGFHIPYLHGALNAAIDYERYTTELFPASSLQLALARGDEHVFDLPPSSPDHGLDVAAYYWWIFPNLMLNVYPWGVSVNVVRPLAPDRTRVSFLSYVWKPEKLDGGAGSGLERVELEDEAVVEAVQRGVRSRLYDRGRYSPTREQGIHHFHRLLARAFAV